MEIFASVFIPPEINTVYGKFSCNTAIALFSRERKSPVSAHLEFWKFEFVVYIQFPFLFSPSFLLSSILITFIFFFAIPFLKNQLLLNEYIICSTKNTQFQCDLNIKIWLNVVRDMYFYWSHFIVEFWF